MLADPNVRFPARPVFADDLQIVAMPEGVGFLIVGEETPVAMRGRHAAAAVEYLRTAMNGSRSVDDLLAACPPGLPGETLLKTLGLLHAKGLLRGPGRPSPTAVDPTLRRQLLFWGRQVGPTRGASSAESVQARLDGASIILIGTGLFGTMVFDLLSRSGCRDIHLIGWDDDGFLSESVAGSPVPPAEFETLDTTSIAMAIDLLRRWADTADLIVSATLNAPDSLSFAVNETVVAAGIPWLRSNLVGADLEVGPLVRPGESACYACARLRESAVRGLAPEQFWYQQDLSRERPAGQTPPRGESLATSSLAASVVVAEVTRCLAGVARPTLVNVVQNFGLLTGISRSNRVLRVPRCQVCATRAVRR
jgi:bacteriocin biosynthesis cyclodehydratase domain-containing protein